MSYLRQICAVFALACMFTVSTWAGDISCGVADHPPPPPPPPQTATASQNVTGETGDHIVQFVMTLLQGALSIL